MSPLVLNKSDPTRIAVAGSSVYVTQDTLTGANDPNAVTVNLSLTNVGSTGSGASVQVTKLAYGTNDNRDVLLAGSTTGLWLSTTSAANSLVQFAGLWRLDFDRIVFDPRSQNRFYVADFSDLYGTTNQGATIQTLTGNLPVHFIRPTALDFISNNGVNALLVTGLNNQVNAQSPIVVADSDSSGNLSNWRLFGSGLPNVPIGALAYNSTVRCPGDWYIRTRQLDPVRRHELFPKRPRCSLASRTNDLLPDASFLSNGSVGNRPLVKYGTGTLTINGNTTYSGSTTVNAGTLIVAGDITVFEWTDRPGRYGFWHWLLARNDGQHRSNANTGPSGRTRDAPTVQGNLIMANGSTYSIQTAPRTVSNANVSGTATLRRQRASQLRQWHLPRGHIFHSCDHEWYQRHIF